MREQANTGIQCVSQGKPLPQRPSTQDKPTQIKMQLNPTHGNRCSSQVYQDFAEHQEPNEHKRLRS